MVTSWFTGPVSAASGAWADLKLCCHICQTLLNPPALQPQMLNSPSWISKAMLVIFWVITIMGLVTRTG